MEVSFSSAKIRKLCESQKALVRRHGDKCARQVMARLADLEAAASLEDFRDLPGKCHELTGDRKGKFALHLPDGKRLVFAPKTGELTRDRGRGSNWSQVDAVCVIEIVEYH